MRILPRGPVAIASFVVRLAALVVTIARLVPKSRRDEPSPAPRAALGPISVVIPARDEEGRLGACLEALRDAAGVAEIVVVDDRSSDGTAALARSFGAHVVDGRELPLGWAGKAWALQQGIEAATHEVVVTLDADTRPSGDLPEWLRGRLDDGADFVSVAGRFDCPTPGARWLHPALLTTLVYRFGIPGSGAATPERVWANGQCTAFRRREFLDAGGLALVAGHVVEDIALARSLAARGWRVEFADGAEHLTVRMFESFADTWRGWGRSLALPGVEPRTRQLLDLAVLTAVQAAPLMRLATGRVDPVDAVALVTRLGTLAGTKRAYRRPGVAYWLSFLADPLAVVRLAWSIAVPSRTWRGRTYPGRTSPG